MMCPDSGPTVFDFGLAKLIESPDEKRTRTGTVMGTPANMPPEQVKGEICRSGRQFDVYSLGVILFESLTSQLPFRGATAPRTGYAFRATHEASLRAE
jgi:serine/threonine protein kinase